MSISIPEAPVALAILESAHGHREAGTAAPGQRRITEARAEFQRVLGDDCVAHAAGYRANTGGIEREIPFALRPTHTNQIVEIVRISRRFKVPLYAISTGHNWGYGCACPAANDSVVVDLSKLNQIVSMDPELGVVTVQPGVTQRMLAEYLDKNQLPFMVPVTGAGPDASLLGNALERGFGITPYSDHFGALMSLEAVLPSGEIYRSALHAAGGNDIDKAFKWGVGPYLDGLFSQSGFGIVTQATLALAPAPEQTEAFFFRCDDSALENAITGMRKILRTMNGTVGAINLMNTLRMLSMLQPYPARQFPPGSVLDAGTISAMAKKDGIPDWTGVGVMYGTRAMVHAAKGFVKSVLKPVARDLKFLTRGQARMANRVLNGLPYVRNWRMAKMAERLQAALENFSGRPSDIALPLAYWKSGRRPENGAMNPAADGCGLRWYAPLLPLKGAEARKFVRIVEHCCRKHGIEPLITLTALTDRCIDSTVPLLFDRQNAEDAARARDCYTALFDACGREGFVPYRLGIDSMHKMVDLSQPFWRLAADIKSAIDPYNLMFPGRYGLS